MTQNFETLKTFRQNFRQTMLPDECCARFSVFLSRSPAVTKGKRQAKARNWYLQKMDLDSAFKKAHAKKPLKVVSVASWKCGLYDHTLKRGND